MFTFGVVDNALSKVTTAPETPVTFLVSTVPSGIIMLIVGLFVVGKSVAEVSSTVISVVVAAFTLPDLLTPALTGSFISITLPGLTIIPESIEVLKFTTSLSLFSLKSIARPNLFA